MPKRGDNKRQKTILNYFSSQSQKPPKEEKQPCIQHTLVTDSLEAMTLDTNPESQVHDTTLEKSPRDAVSALNKESPSTEENKSLIKKTKVEKEENKVESVDEDEEEEIVVSRSKRKRKLKRVIEASSSDDNNSEEDDAEEDIPVTTRLAKLRQKHQQKHQRLSFMKQDDEQCDEVEDDNRIICDEELDFLDKSDILQERTRGRKVSRYTEALKKLSNRKSKLDSYQGESGPIEKYSTTSKAIEIDADSDSSSGVDEGNDNNNNSDDLEDFVVDDDIIDGEKNAVQDSEMAFLEMPAEFSKARTNSFSKQLKIYLEYLVALSINPLFDITTNRQYQIAKNTVLRRVQGYKDSIVTSDVWLTSFKEAVDKYPEWEFVIGENDDLWGFGFFTCEACRSNKPASAKVILSSDTSPSSITLHLGSECCRKGELYHQLYHFELHMYNEVKSKVVTEMMMISDRHPQQQQQQHSRKNHQNPQQQQTSTIYHSLRKSGYIKRLRNQVRDLFNTVIHIYNLRNQRSRILNDSSSSSSSSSDDDNGHSDDDNNESVI